MNELDKLIDSYTREIVEVYRNIETEIIYEVARLWGKNVNFEGDIRLFITKLNEMDVMNEEVLKLLAKLTGRPLQEIKNTVKVIGGQAIDYEPLNKAYSQGYLNVNPMNVPLNKVINAHQRSIVKEFKTMHDRARLETYKRTHRSIMKASMQVELGIKSPNQAIVEAVKELSSKGITGDSYLREGKEIEQSIESVVRRYVRSSFTQTANAVNEAMAEELGTEHWYVTQHLGARTTHDDFRNHAKWQGKVYTDEEMVTVCGEGHIQGFDGANCKHLKWIHIPGVSVEPPPLLNMEELERVYELEQTQRRYERSIRYVKREIKALEQLDCEESFVEQERAKTLLKRRQKKLREYIAKNGDVLRRDYTREKVV